MESPLVDLPLVAVIRVHRTTGSRLAIQVLQVDPHGESDLVLGHAQSAAELCALLSRWLEHLVADGEPDRETEP